MNATDILLKTLRKGWQTSEFWLTTVGLVILPGILVKSDALVDKTTGELSERGLVGSIAAGAMVGAYNIGRAYVKGKTAAALLAPVDATAVVRTLPDTVSAEIERSRVRD